MKSMQKSAKNRPTGCFFCHGSSGLQQNWLNTSTGTKFPPAHQKSQRFVRRITLGTSRLASWLLKGAVYLPSLKRISKFEMENLPDPKRNKKSIPTFRAMLVSESLYFWMGWFDWGWNFPSKNARYVHTEFLQVRTEANTFSPPAAKCPLMTQMYRPSSHGISHFLLGTINHHTTAHRVWEIPFVGWNRLCERTVAMLRYF